MGLAITQPRFTQFIQKLLISKATGPSSSIRSFSASPWRSQWGISSEVSWAWLILIGWFEDRLEKYFR